MTPKIDLHCHIEGAAQPDLVRELAKRNAIYLPESLFDERGDFAWSNFLEFLNAYDLASSCIRTPLDYRDVTYEYLKSCAAEGAIYAEFFSSPDHAAANGISYGGHIEGMVQGINDAERDFGIIGRIIVTCVRHLGPERAVAVADAIISEPHPHVVGFGMGGDENKFDISEFAPAFDRVNQSGLPTTVHAGEIRGPESVSATLDVLPVSRIGHGVRSIEDKNLIDRIIEMDITLEVCPGSNLALGIYGSVNDHPLRELMHVGCRVALGSDDPPFFATTIGAEYNLAKNEFGLSGDEISTINRNALDGAFCDEATKNLLRAKL